MSESMRFLAKGIIDHAARKGDLSADGMLHGERWEGGGVSWRTDDGVEFHDCSSPDSRKYPEQRSLYMAATERGLYIVWEAYEDGALNFDLEAVFVPAGATSPEAVEAVYSFTFASSELGGNLLRACYSREESKRYIDVANRVRKVVDKEAASAVDAHRAGRPASTPDPFDQVSPEMRADVAVREYPWRQVLGADSCGPLDTWVCHLPDGRILRAREHGQPLVDYLVGDRRYWGTPPDMEEDEVQWQWFRPTDEDVDPGLAERFRTAGTPCVGTRLCRRWAETMDAV